MVQNTLAPWAELVPGRGPMTVDDLLALPDDTQWQYELVDGRLVRMSPTGGGHGGIAGNLHIALGIWVVPRQLGRVLSAETGFQLGPNTVLAGDVAFVQGNRLPARDSATWERFWPLAPDLVAEVISPSQKASDQEAKARAWIGAGVRLAWIIWPKRQQVDVWQANAAGAPELAATLKPGDALDGLDVLPGFSYPLAELFA